MATITSGGTTFEWGYEYDEGHANIEREDAVMVVLMDAETEEVLATLGGITGDFEVSDHGNINVTNEFEEYLSSVAMELAEAA